MNPISMNILQRQMLPRNGGDWWTWAQSKKIALETKYGIRTQSSLDSRASGLNLYVNHRCYPHTLLVSSSNICWLIRMSNQNADSRYALLLAPMKL